jgi:DNA-binding IclR family transcriptional regulator
MVLSPQTPGPPDSVRSVERALDLLSALERAGEPVGLSHLARSTGIPKPTVQRLLAVLERRGLVQRERGAYLVGAAILPLAGAFLTRDSLSRASLPVLEELSHLSGETTSLQVRQGFDRIVAQRVHSSYSLGYTLRIGLRLPLHIGASGLVLSAAMPDDQFLQFLDTVREIRLASGETLTREACLSRLERVRQQGFAISHGEREAGVVSIAAPVARPSGEVIAAVALTGPPSRLPEEKIEALSLEVRRAAREIAHSYSRS